METISRYLLTFLLNSLWQIPLVAAVAALVCRAMRRGPAVHRHAVWIAALVAAVLVPLASVRQEPPAPAAQFDASLVMQGAASGSPALPARSLATVPARQPAPSAPEPRAISFATTTATVLIGIYFLFLLARLTRLALASIRTLALRRRAHAAPVSEPLAGVWMRCGEAFGVTGAELLFSDTLGGPVTAGRAIILPETLLAETSEELLTAAIGHEMAHIARRDFACNLLFEILRVPVSFHPAAWLIRRGIAGAREMACDELVTGRLIDAGAYARSILSIAARMTAPAPAAYTLSVLDGDNLEERIRRLTEPPRANPNQARLLLIGGLAALVLCAVAASSLAVSARAQDGASDLMKQATAAYNRGDYPQSADLFQQAVRVEPANLKAKLFLASALLRQYTPGADPSNPLVIQAGQQYSDVLALDPANKSALEGMTNLLVVTKQFSAAHDWTLKAIQANPSDANLYYTAGFTDWSMAYPDYAAARRQAGMKPADPGNIPDATLREALRAQHGAQLEDGFRMLQIALQLNPDFSDAMAYLNLLYRIQAGMADTPEQAAALIGKADDWVAQALAAKKRAATHAAATPPADVDGLALAPITAAPPPPPPPPPPPGGGLFVGPRVQQAKLISAPAPVYPQAAREAGISGEVVLNIGIDKEGSVSNVQVVSGDPLLTPAAVDAVRQWRYALTLVDGQPVGVTTQISMKFMLGH